MKITGDDLLLYAITDAECIGQRDFFSAVEDALKGGATIVQLREKGLSEQELIDKAKKMTKLCHKYGVPLIVNDNYIAAIKAGADGVHVGIEDTPPEVIRKTAGNDFLIGATAKTAEQARAAENAGADYLGVGAVFASPTKKNAIRITHSQMCEIAKSVSIPTVAIGGINESNISELYGCGASGAAFVSAIFSSDDITSQCKKLKELSRKLK